LIVLTFVALAMASNAVGSVQISSSDGQSVKLETIHRVKFPGPAKPGDWVIAECRPCEAQRQAAENARRADEQREAAARQADEQRRAEQTRDASRVQAIAPLNQTSDYSRIDRARMENQRMEAARSNPIQASQRADNQRIEALVDKASHKWEDWIGCEYEAVTNWPNSLRRMTTPGLH
jgi:hypothetical protein